MIFMNSICKIINVSDCVHMCPDVGAMQCHPCKCHYISPPIKKMRCGVDCTCRMQMALHHTMKEK